MTTALNAFMRGLFTSLFPALSYSTNGNGTGNDMVDYEGVAVVQLDSAAGSAGTLDYKLQESNDNGVGDAYADVPVAEITGGAFVQVTTGGASLQTRYIDLGQRKRWIRGVRTIATGPFVFSSGIVAQKKVQN